MDCCNYLQQRQPYYGMNYYEAGPYPTDYLNQNPYNNVHHYNNQWAFTSACSPDYVYNPKEARLRKALRERERTIGAGSGSSQGCIQRARRSPHWATAPGKVLPPAPSHMQHHAAEHLMGGPGKDMRGMQSDFNRGFMNMNGGTGSGYFFSGPQYQINPQSDYPAYIVSPNGWMPNGYVQNNAMMQQQFWNQYQAERMRVHQQSQGSAYMMQPEEPQYQHVEPLPPAPIIQHPMEPAAKEILTNIENSCSDVSSYLNMNSSNGCSAMSCATNSTNVEVNTPTNVIDVAASCDEAPPSIPEQSQSVSVRSEQDLAGNLNAGGSNTGAEEGNTVEGGSGENAASGFDMQLFEEGSLASISSQELHKSINSANPLRCRDSRKNSGNSLPGFNQAFGSTERGRFQSAPEPIRIGSAESEYLEYYTSYNIKFEQYSKWADQANNATSPPPLLSTDFNKAPEQAENLETKTIEHIPQAHNQKPESLHEPLISPYFSVEALQNKSIQGPSNIQPFSTPFENSFYLEYMAPEFMIPNQENQTAKTDDFPLDFSAQKYFETVPGNFDPGYMTGGFLCEDGFTFIPFPNQPEYTSNYAFQSEYDYIVTDGSKLDMKTEPSGSKIDDNYILDLSKMSEEENDIDQCSAAKFTEVSSRICDELAKII